jgi:hypothetical protein
MTTRFAAILAVAFMTLPVYSQVPGNDANSQPESRSRSAIAGQQGGAGSLKDAVELCERLAGVEREICLRQAQENRERAASAPTPPGSGSAPRGASGNDSGAGTGAAVVR